MEELKNNPIDDLENVENDESGAEETLNFENSAKDWLSKFGENVVYTCTLVKLEGDNRNKPVVCDSYNNEVPSVRDIGLSYGSGNYQVVISSKTSVKRKRATEKQYFFVLHSIWDKRKADHDLNIKRLEREKREETETIKPGVADPLELSFKIMDRFMGYMVSMSNRAPVSPVSAPISDDMSKVMAEHYGRVDNLLNDVLKKKIDILNSESYDDDDQEREENVESMPVSVNNSGGSLVELITKFLPLIMTTLKMGKGEEGLSSVLSNPAVAELLKNKDDLSSALQILDKKVGVTTVNKMLKAAKIKRPE